MEGRSIAQKIGRFLFDFLTYLVIVAGILFGLPKFLSWSLNTSYPMAAITSGSMWPSLKEGELVFIEGVEKSDLRKGDIVVYRNSVGGTFTIHRIVALGETTLTTKGDANFNEDTPVSYEQVVGRSLTFGGRNIHIPYLGSITVFANNVREQRE